MILPLAAAAVLVTAGAAMATTDPAPIGPNQYFSGDVNGAAADATIRTTCVGPIVAGQTGHPVAGQWVEVLASAATSNIGFTGTTANSITAVLEYTPTGTATIIGTIHDYAIALPVPTTLTVPCGGAGVAAFVPTPSSPTAKTATVNVRFVPQP
jgi:hypothetical protein